MLSRKLGWLAERPYTRLSRSTDKIKRSKLAWLHGADIGASGLGVYLEDAARGDTEAEFDIGYGARGFAGYEIIDDLRLELEGSYRNNDVDKLTNGGSLDADGEVEAIAGMVNAYYDFGFIPFVTPSIGVELAPQESTLT